MKRILSLLLALTLAFTACNESTPPLSSQSNNPNLSAFEPVTVTLDDAWLIMQINNPYIEHEPDRMRFIGDGTITNVQGEILDPSVGLSSRLIKEAEFPDVYLFEIDGSDFDGKYQANHYAVTKTGGILYINESVTNTYGRDDVWVALTGGFVPLDDLATLPELVIYDISSMGLSYTLRNATGQDFMYGSTFQLLMRNGSEWEPVKVMVNDGFFCFTSEGYTVTSQSQSSPRNVAFEWAFGELPQGEYKFVKDIMDFRRTGDFDKYDLEQTFIIS